MFKEVLFWILKHAQALQK